MTEPYEQIRAAHEHALAQRDAFADLCVQLLALVRETGGYMTHGKQTLLREADAALAEVGR